MFRKISRWSLLVLAIIAISPATSKADIMDVDVSGVAAPYQSYFLGAEAFWESRIIGYSKSLPRILRNQLTKLQITATTADIDGSGGVLGQAGPTDVVTYRSTRPAKNYAVARRSMMQFDNADLADMLANGSLMDVIKHEMAHAMGLGSLWSQNDLLGTTRQGVTQYIGKYGLRAYRKESGNAVAPFVPIDQTGGPGTALSHWDLFDPFFNQPNLNRSELMIGYVDGSIDGTPDGPDRKFVSETTWGSFADLGYAVKGINEGFVDKTGGGSRPSWPKWSGPQRPIFIRGGAVPEPTTAGVLAIFAVGGLGLVRRRRHS
ncbi:MAG: PEP-CTERM sorting domain-containing protein [Pirellulaceae bacterium]